MERLALLTLFTTYSEVILLRPIENSGRSKKLARLKPLCSERRDFKTSGRGAILSFGLLSQAQRPEDKCTLQTKV